MTTVISNRTTTTVVSGSAPTTVVQSKSGPQGPAGSGQFRTVLAAESVNGHRCVVESAANQIRHAQLGNVSDAELIVGITSSAATAGGSVGVVVTGAMVEPSWAWVTGLPIFCGADGVLTQSIPSDGQLWSVCVGVATSTTSMQVDIEPPIFRE